MPRLELHYTSPTVTKKKLIDLPEDWHEMTENDRADFVTESAADFVLESVKYGGKVVED